MRKLVIRPVQDYGNTASLSYPDTWARKPDCLNLPYINPFFFHQTLALRLILLGGGHSNPTGFGVLICMRTEPLGTWELDMFFT